MIKNVIIDFTPKTTSMDWIFNGVFQKENSSLDFFTEDQIRHKINEILSKMPDKLLNVADSLGWKIIATNNRNLEVECGALSEVYGYTNFEKKEFVIYTTIKGIEESLPHELAHFLDMLIGVSNSREWGSVYNEEKELYERLRYRFTAVNQKEECFSDAVMLYVLDNNCLKRYCPKTYKVINNIFTYIEYLLNDRCIAEYKKQQEELNLCMKSLTQSTVFSTSYDSYNF